MSVQMLTAPRLAPQWRPLMLALPALALGLLLIGLLFRDEIAAAVGVWYASTAYSHCFFVIPIAAYLAWDRRDGVAAMPVRPLPWAGLLALPLGAVWLVAERIGIMEGRQILAISMVQVLFLAVLGWRMWWALSAALLYLYFLVPFGAFLTPALQHFTAAFIPVGLNLLGIPNYADEYMIDIPAGRFYVAEACAGLRFLIASVAFGVLYAALIYRSPWRRLGFVLASIVVPVVANGFRALGIVVLGHVLGSAEAAAADHLIYGWVFFSVVILLLVAAGMPFREDLVREDPDQQDLAPRTRGLPEPATGRDAGWTAAMPATAAVVLLAAVAPGLAAWVDREQGNPPALAGFAAPPGCTAPDAPPEGPGLLRFRCPAAGWPRGLALSVQIFAPTVNPGIIVGRIRAGTAEVAAEEVETGNLPEAGGSDRIWRLTSTTRPNQVTATLLWLDGEPTPFGLRARIQQARSALTGASNAPVLVSVSADGGTAWTAGADQQAARRAVAAFLQQNQGFLDAVASGLVKGRT